MHALPRYSDIDLQVLADVQAYLRARADGRATSERSRQAWEQFFTTFDSMIRRVVGACNLPPADADDCVQEVWTELLRKLPAFRYDPRRGRFCAWLFILARHRVIDFLRALGRQHPKSLADLDKWLLCRDLNPAESYETHREQQVVRTELQKLSHRLNSTSYAILESYLLFDRNATEISDQLGLTPRQIRERLNRAKATLHGSLKEALRVH